MADQKKTESAEEAITIDPKTAALFAQFIKEMRTPYVDEQKESRKESARLALRQNRADAERSLEHIRSQCSHLRENGTNRVAFAQFFYATLGGYDWEGFCQGCGKHFKRGTPETAKQLQVPTGMGIGA